MRLDVGAGKRLSARAGLRPDLRLREDQRRVLRAGARRRRGGGRPRRTAGRHQPRRWSSRRSATSASSAASARCIKYGGAAMVDPALKRSFAEEVVLLQSAGLKPVIVHGGGPGDHADAGEAGAQVRVRRRAAHHRRRRRSQVVEMVLTGRINTEIVGLHQQLGRQRHRPVGQGRAAADARTSCSPPRASPTSGFVGEIEASTPTSWGCSWSAATCR